MSFSRPRKTATLLLALAVAVFAPLHWAWKTHGPMPAMAIEVCTPTGAEQRWVQLDPASSSGHHGTSLCAEFCGAAPALALPPSFSPWLAPLISTLSLSTTPSAVVRPQPLAQHGRPRAPPAA